jgi:hypothetical protein
VALPLAAAARAGPAAPLPITGTKVATATPASPAYSALEGGATDGTSWYSAVLHNRKSGTGFLTSVELVKTPLNGSTPVRTADFPLRSDTRSNLLGHANGMTYNADTGQLVVAAWTNDSSKQFAHQASTVRFVDPSSLRIVGSKVLSRPLTSICYDATGNRYLGRQGGTAADTYTVYDAKLSAKRTFVVPAGDRKGISQSVDCDQSFVYVLRSADRSKGQTHNLVYVYDWSGKSVGTYAYATSSEGEHLTHAGGRLYAGFNIGAGQLYALDGLQYTVTYGAGGGTGSMAPTVVLYGRATRLRPNAFTRAGYTFAGWTLRRSTDGAQLYVDPADGSRRLWLTGPQPASYRLAVYRDGVNVARTVTQGTLQLTAAWTAR